MSQSERDAFELIKRSRLSYSETLTVLKDAIVTGGGTIFASIDQAAAAESVGMTLRPTTLIVFGNPRGGTPLMEAYPHIALELPLKLLVWEESGVVSVAYEPITEIAPRYGVTGMDERIHALDRNVDALTDVLT